MPFETYAILHRESLISTVIKERVKENDVKVTVGRNTVISLILNLYRRVR